MGTVARMQDRGYAGWQVEAMVRGMRRVSSLGIQMTRKETWVARLLWRGRGLAREVIPCGNRFTCSSRLEASALAALVVPPEGSQAQVERINDQQP